MDWKHDLWHLQTLKQYFCACICTFSFWVLTMSECIDQQMSEGVRSVHTLWKEKREGERIHTAVFRVLQFKLSCKGRIKDINWFPSNSRDIAKYWGKTYWIYCTGTSPVSWCSSFLTLKCTKPPALHYQWPESVSLGLLHVSVVPP